MAKRRNWSHRLNIGEYNHNVKKPVEELEKASQARYRVLYISDSALTPRNFYWETLHELDYEPKFYRGDAKRQLQKALAVLVDNERKSPVVIVEEAQLLSR